MSIEKLRTQIDEIDLKILELLNERAKLAIQIGKIKKEYYSPTREKEIFRQLQAANRGPLPQNAIQTIYREIISASRALEKPLTLAYLGPPATFTHLASTQEFGSSANFIPVDTITDVFNEVEKGNTNYGVVPIENSTEGIVNSTLDMFLESNLKICAEILLQISHHFMSKANDMSQIKTVYSTPQSTAQSRIWIRNNLANIQLKEVPSTARAAELASKDSTTAAIASKLAAEIYHLQILHHKIEDNPYNKTRFLVIGYSEPERTGKDKTSIMFSVKHEAGALYKALSPFQKHQINMTMIESRPTKQTPWEYNFFVDFQGHQKDPQVVAALENLKKQCLFLRILGSYPEAE